jgi:hypothetical protein
MPLDNIAQAVIQSDETQQRVYMCGFGYGVQMGDQLVPFG